LLLLLYRPEVPLSSFVSVPALDAEKKTTLNLLFVQETHQMKQQMMRNYYTTVDGKILHFLSYFNHFKINLPLLSDFQLPRTAAVAVDGLGYWYHHNPVLGASVTWSIGPVRLRSYSRSRPVPTLIVRLCPVSA
jgi:hypothetical protein